MISHCRIPADRRVVNALLGLSGLRIGEAAALRWRHIDFEETPLTKITVARPTNGRTKTKRTALVPVHPRLDAILRDWKASGWPARHGARPRLEDLVVPGPPGPMWSDKRFRDRFQRDLPKVGLRLEAGARKRSPHGLRASFLTLAVEDGAVFEIVDRVVHPPGRRGRRAGPLYLRPDWEALCREVAKLRNAAPDPAERPAEGVESVQDVPEVGANLLVAVEGLEPPTLRI